jgi:hypothetical protein
MTTGIRLFVWAAAAMAMFIVATLGNDEESRPVSVYIPDPDPEMEALIVDGV